MPDWLQHYRARPMTPWLEPLAFLGVNDDLTSETRLDEDAYRYIPEPGPDLPYFQLSAARDPRPLIIHEGVPGHYYQMALSWAQERPVRRRYIDSSVNEGIALYVEELLLQAGLFDFSPRSREIIYSYARLRALRRALVDVVVPAGVVDGGDLQADVAGADDHDPLGRLQVVPDGVDVVDAAQVVDAGEVAARQLEPADPGTGGEHQVGLRPAAQGSSYDRLQ